MAESEREDQKASGGTAQLLVIKARAGGPCACRSSADVFELFPSALPPTTTLNDAVFASIEASDGMALRRIAVALLALAAGSQAIKFDLVATHNAPQ